MAEMMTTEKKYYDKDDFASKGVANTALGLSIAGLGTQLLNGNLNLGNLLGGNNTNQTNQELFGIYKGYRDADDAIIAKHNTDAFALYKNQRDEKDCLQKQIDAINAKLAVTDTNQFWQMKNLTDAIALEAERRQCNDGKLVNYMNTTFAPKYIADFTVGTTTTQQTLFNPLCTPNCGC